MPAYKRNWMYPLSDMELRAFRSFFHTKFGQVLFYVTDTFIQSTYLEFADVVQEMDDGTANTQTNLAMDICAMCEDLHSSMHQQRAITKEIEAKLTFCKECKGTGVHWTLGVVCPRCHGTAKVPRRTRS